MRRRIIASGFFLSVLMPGDGLAQELQFTTTAFRPVLQLVPSSLYQGHVLGGDFDRDGRTDLLATIGVVVPPNARVILGSPIGMLPGQGLVFAWNGHRPRAVDLDGDGDLDLVFAPPRLPTQGTIHVFENWSASFYSVPLPWALGTLVQAADCGDVDGDGFVDLVIAVGPGALTPSIVLARGGSGLRFTVDVTSTPANLPLGLWPTVFDADGDGDLDVLASNATSGLRLLRNVGGSFVDATSSLPPARTGHTLLAAADFDGDGRGDCAAALATGDVDVLWGAAGGLMILPLPVASVPGITDLSTADFDGDGDADLLARHGNGLDGLWSDGNRSFARVPVVDEPVTTHGIADLDADGHDDVVFGTTPVTSLRVKYQGHLEDAAASLGTDPVSGNKSTSPVGDVDGDGRSDFVQPILGELVIDHALGGGAYARTRAPLPGASGGGVWRSDLADMDRDGDLDLVVKDNARIAVFDNNGTGSFTLAMQRAHASAAMDDLRLGDVDRDGDLDIVQSDLTGTLLTRNLGGGLYATPVVIAPQSSAIELADTDGDVDLDVITASSAQLRVATNDGTGTFSVGPTSPVAHMPASIRAGDTDGDGDRDLLLADGVLHVYRNDGTGRFTDTSIADLQQTNGMVLSNAVLADLDGDGHLDVSAFTFNRLLLLCNDGMGRFLDRSTARVQPQFSGSLGEILRSADIDDDGDLDLLVSGSSSRQVLVNKQRGCRSNAPLRLGGQADIHLLSGPGFGQPGVGLVGVGFALATPPLRVAGFAGQLELDPATLQTIAAVTTSPIGVSSAFAPVPRDTALLGLDVWFQGLLAPTGGQPAFTSAIKETILP